jgi:threonine dehydratase
VVEPSGATALAAVMAKKLSLPRGPAVAILSGGNVDLEGVLGMKPSSVTPPRDGGGA